MWLIEKDPDGNDHIPINTVRVAYISTGNWEGSFYIRFHMAGTDNVRWNYSKEKDRDKYLEKIREKLPKFDLGINDISL